MRAHHTGTPAARLVVLLVLVSWTAVGCFRDPDPIEIPDDDLAVHAVLETGADSAVVLLNRPGGSSDFFGQVRGVPGAEVRLIRDGDTIGLLEDPSGSCLAYGGVGGPGGGCYQARLATPLSPGAPVRLEVGAPDGVRATGRTVPPQPVAVMSPNVDARIGVRCGDPDTCFAESLFGPPYRRPLAEIPVAWDAPPSVVRAEVFLRPVAVFSGGVEYPGDACYLGFAGGDRALAGDSTLWQVVNVGCGAVEDLAPARFDSIRAELTVTGWNEEYARWIDARGGEGIRVDAASPGIEGAFGVFGAVSTARRSILLVRQ